MQDVNTLKGLHGVKTLASSKKRSLSRAQSSPFLDLYMVEKERERLVKESQRLELRHNQVKQRLKEIDAFRETVRQSTIKRTAAEAAEEAAPVKTWKKVSMKY